MSKVTLTQSFVDAAQCLSHKTKHDYFDTKVIGLLLKVLPSDRKSYYLRGCDIRGHKFEKKFADAKTTKLESARSLATQYLAQITLGQDPFAKKKELKKVPTMEAFTRDSYLPFIKSYKKSWDTDEGLIRNHINPYFGKMHLDEIKQKDFIDFISKHSVTHKPGSVNRVIILMRYIMNCAKRWEIPNLSKNPTAGVPLREENNKIERYLSADEANRLMDQLRSSPNKMLYYIIGMLILTGARKREVLDAKWEDFDIERQLWRIPISKSGKARHVPLSDGAISLLNQLPKLNGCHYVFANPATKLPYISIFSAWDSARKKAGLKDVRIHDLRHSFASFLVNSGRSLYEVQKILGHTQIKTTQRYAHLSQDSLKAAANEVGKIISIDVKPQLMALG
jgi:integrase